MKHRKKKLYAIGYDELKRAIERYDSSERQTIHETRQHIFNGGYVDYLDANYQEPPERRKTNPTDTITHQGNRERVGTNV